MKIIFNPMRGKKGRCRQAAAMESWIKERGAALKRVGQETETESNYKVNLNANELSEAKLSSSR